jgi:pimeloyl-ACP methyl ester carboxylesterase
MRGRGPFARWRPEFLELYARYGLHRREDGQYELACSPDSEAQIYENAVRHDPWPALRSLTIPSLYLRATRHEGGPPPFPQATAETIPHSRLQEVDTTHFVPMEAPEVVLDAMTSFFAEA